MGSLFSSDRKKKIKIDHVWCIGWIKKNEKGIIFINHIADNKTEEIFVSLCAKVDAEERLIKIID